MLDDTVTAFHADLAQEEPAAIREQIDTIVSAMGEVVKLVDRQAKDDDLPSGWWLALIPLLLPLRSRLRWRLYRLTLVRLSAVATSSVAALQRALQDIGDDVPLAILSIERLHAAALSGPDGVSWPEWSAKTADDLFQRLASDFRTAHTRREVDELVSRARKLAVNAATTATITGMHSVANRARLAAASQDPRFSKWRYTAVLDDRTSLICRTLDGTTWNFNDPNAPYPPRHPNCRSIVVPL